MTKKLLGCALACAFLLGGCAQHDAQPMPTSTVSQSGYSSKLGKLGTSHHSARRTTTRTAAAHKNGNNNNGENRA